MVRLANPAGPVILPDSAQDERDMDELENKRYVHRHRCPLRYLSLVLLALAATGTAACEQPNVVLVTVDTLRADHLDVHGYPRATAPALTEIARFGVRFDQAHSQAPWTLPSMASVHSSLYPSQHGAVQALTALPDSANTLAEYLRATGYHTVAVISHDFVDQKHGFGQGFDVFVERNEGGHSAVTSETLTRDALAQLDDAEEPFFLWVHYFDPHFTYVRHPEIGFADGYSGSLPDALSSERLVDAGREMSRADLDYVKAVYDEEIRHTDHWVGTLWNDIRLRFGEDRTVLIFTANHGEYFLERGRFFHGRDVYSELVHVPLVIAGAIDETLHGTVVQQPVETRSIPKTVAGMLERRSGAFDGVDLLDVARGGRSAPVFSEGSRAWNTDQRKRAVVHEGWKLIHDLERDGFELYHLPSDPPERRDLWRDRRGVPDELIPTLQSLLQDFSALPRLSSQPIGSTPEVIDRLRSLGYVR